MVPQRLWRHISTLPSMGWSLPASLMSPVVHTVGISAAGQKSPMSFSWVQVGPAAVAVKLQFSLSSPHWRLTL